MLEHPPKPRLTLRVGVAGHRPKPHRFPRSDVGRVEAQLRQVFAAIGQALKAAQIDSADLYSTESAHVRLVSGMAEGADQLAVSARPEKWSVDAILPFPLTSYLRDFEASAVGDGRDVRPEFEAALAKAQTVTQLPEQAGARDAAYARLGAFLLRQIDILIAIWDGGPSEGPGGTTDVVKKAIDVGIPVVWICSREDTSLRENAHRAEYPRIIDEIKDGSEPIAADVDCTRGRLNEVISSITSGPTPANLDRDSQPNAAQRLIQFLGEMWPLRSRWTAYNMFRQWAERKPIQPIITFAALGECGGEWHDFVSEAPPAGTLTSRVLDVVKPRYLWADTLAIYFGSIYRSAYIVVYLLSAAAVGIGLLGLLSHAIPERTIALDVKALVVAIELVIIGRIFTIVRSGRRGRWHQRFVEYRALAEMLRGLRFLAYVGENGRILRADATPASAWFLWYVRATIRELGLPNAVLDGSYQWAHLVAVEKHTIAEQIEYHTRNVKTFNLMNWTIRLIGDCCFYGAVGVLCIWLAGWILWAAGTGLNLWPNFFGWLDHVLDISKDVVTGFAAGLPALGAALAGIRETTDFEGAAVMSVKTAAALGALRADYGEAKRTLLLDETGDVLVATAQVLTEDLTSWQQVYGRKRLTLPG